MRLKREFFMDALHIFILFSLVLAQPLYVLSRNVEFFVTRHSKPADVVSLVLVLCVMLPALFVLFEAMLGLFSQRLRKVAHYIIVAGLLAVIVLIILKKQIAEFPGVILLTGATFIGIVAAIAYIRFISVRKFLTFLSPAILLFPGLFLFNSPVFKVVFPEKDVQTIYSKVDANIPVVMVVFDEFPITSLMDENRQIDPIRYPNFAALARDAYWFRNATTVAESTVYAVPAILSGSYPEDPFKIPTVADYPHNLFTLLGDSYEMKVFESHTMLCPETLCEKFHQTFVQRMYSMISDLSIVYLHIILPSDLTSWLPVVTQTWKGFGIKTKVPEATTPGMKEVLDHARASYNDRSGLFATFVESITASNRPTLYFLHIMLPHVPWEYLPSGKIYTEEGFEIPGLNIKEEKWADDEWLVIQGYQRHLLQVGFVDKLLGDLLAKLRTLKLYDRSLIVITADHGVNFWPDKQRRNVSEGNPMDILPVPLFIKKPEQHRGIIVDDNVETVDILPTIADILNIPLPWPVDGHSALDKSLTGRTEKRIYNYVHKKFVFDSAFVSRTKYASLSRKLDLFGSGAKRGGLFKIGPYNSLVGRRVSSVDVSMKADAVFGIYQADFYRHIDTEGSFLPAQIKGRLLNGGSNNGPLDLAIAVNGTISAVTRTFTSEGKEVKFSAVVPESSFLSGKNDIEVFVIDRTGGQLTLRSAVPESKKYSLLSLNGQNFSITSSDGTSISVVPDTLTGYFNLVDIQGDYVNVFGWAADLKNSQPPEAIVIFIDGTFVYSGYCNLERPDVARHFDAPELKRSGFQYTFPIGRFKKDIAHSEVRIFAISKDGVASELHYNEGYKQDKKS